jgi:hypothetical protein
MPAQYATLEIKVKTEALDKLKIQLDDLEKQIKRINQNPIATTGSEYSPTIKTNTTNKTANDRSISIDVQQLNQLKKITSQNDKMLALMQQAMHKANLQSPVSSGGGIGALTGAAIASMLRGFRSKTSSKYQMPPLSSDAPHRPHGAYRDFGEFIDTHGTSVAIEREWEEARKKTKAKKPWQIDPETLGTPRGTIDLGDKEDTWTQEGYENWKANALRAGKSFGTGESAAINLDVLGQRFSQARKWLSPRLSSFLRGEQTPETKEARRRMHGLEPTDNIDLPEQSGTNAEEIERLERKYAQKPKPFQMPPDFESPNEAELAQFSSAPPQFSPEHLAEQAEKIRKNQERIDAWRAMANQPGGSQLGPPSVHLSDPQLNIRTNAGGTSPGSIRNFLSDESGALNLGSMRRGLNIAGGAIGTGLIKASEIAAGFKTALIAVGFTATAVRSAHLAAPRDFEIMEGKINALLAKIGMAFLPVVRSAGNAADWAGSKWDNMSPGQQELVGNTALGIGGGLAANWAAKKAFGTGIGGLGGLAVRHPYLSIPIAAGAATLGLGKAAQLMTEGSGATKNDDGSFTLNQSPSWFGRQMQNFGHGTNRVLQWFGMGKSNDEYLSQQAWGANRQPALPPRNAPRLSGITEAWGQFQQSFMPEGEMQLRMQQYKNAGMGPTSPTGGNLNLATAMAGAIDNSASGLALKIIAANTANLGMA